MRFDVPEGSLPFVSVDESLVGQFYAGDSYIVKHSAKRGTAIVDTYYIWQGSASSQEPNASKVSAPWSSHDHLPYPDFVGAQLLKLHPMASFHSV